MNLSPGYRYGLSNRAGEARMSFLKALCISFAIYSKIPVPHFEWTEKEMRFQLIFFPWVGAVIGALLVLWKYVCDWLPIGNIPYVLIDVAIPLLVTGGFHVDGYMDTMDALKSYKTREEKLEILKDPHIGAFSVIMLAVAGLIFAAAMAGMNRSFMVSFAGAFFLSRSLSGTAVMIFPPAKKDGMLRTFGDTSGRGKNNAVLIALLVEAAAGAAFMIIMNVLAGLFMVLAALVVFLYYRNKSLKEFGGITGDTAGFFVTVSEIAMAVAAWAVSVIAW